MDSNLRCKFAFKYKDTISGNRMMVMDDKDAHRLWVELTLYLYGSKAVSEVVLKGLNDGKNTNQI
jgi:hypothetical protein